MNVDLHEVRFPTVSVQSFHTMKISSLLPHPLRLRNCLLTAIFLVLLITWLLLTCYFKSKISVNYDHEQPFLRAVSRLPHENVSEPVKFAPGDPAYSSTRNLNELGGQLSTMNLMGGSWTTLEYLKNLLWSKGNSFTVERMAKVMARIKKRSLDSAWLKLKDNVKVPGTQINIAIVSCGSERRKESMAMIKSVLMFSRDARIHFVVFTDKNTVVDVALDILELKWTVNSLGWDFTYELHLEWFPDTSDGVVWREMWRPCTTQRLFFPSLLPHIDSVIYVDTDMIILSNITELWSDFSKMGHLGLAAMTANSEEPADGWYHSTSKIPYYGSRGVNAGLMLMNLTRMREFNFQKRALAAQLLYKEKIFLADQDIVNIIFHTFPEKMHLLECSFNFNWIHCGKDSEYKCYEGSKSICFCNPAISSGIRIVHGNSLTFSNKYFGFLPQIYQAFETFDLLTDSPVDLISNLTDRFHDVEHHCGPLTSKILYGNAAKYFSRLGLDGNIK